MKPKLIFHALWAFIFVFLIWSCSRPSRPTPEGTATIIADNVTITTFPSLAISQNPNLESTLYPTLPFTKTATVTPTPTPTNTYQPTTTPSATVTPVPTVIPTITPTFDAYHLATATRSPAEVCPEKKAGLKPPDFELMSQPPPIVKHFQQDYLDFFNNGGIADTLPAHWKVNFIIDLTNDRVPELIFQQGDVFILGCRNGNYQLLLDIRMNDDLPVVNEVIEVQDANQNGFPELILEINTQSRKNTYAILEWDASNIHSYEYTSLDGTQFRSLWTPNDRHINNNGLFESLYGSPDFKFQAMNLDTLLELAVHIIPPYFQEEFNEGYPWRNELDYYTWNGSSYVFAKQVYDPPLFRFQAVHDGDWAFLRGDYDQAVNFYQQAIKDDDLYWYTEERRYFMLMNEPGWNAPTVTPVKPVINPVEYPNLVAYSYFRMMLAEIKRGHPSGAQIIYDWLKANFTQGMPGYVYVDLATLFWDEYQKSHDFALSCSSTYDYASTHPEEVFRYLTTQIAINKKLITWPDPIPFGYQSAELEYSPGMICPSQ